MIQYQFLDVAAYRVLQYCPEEGRPLLCQLRTFIFRGKALDHLREALLIVGQNLKHLSLSFCAEGEKGSDAINMIRCRWPKLETLSVCNSVVTTPTLMVPVQALFCSQNSLRGCTLILSSQHIDPNILNHLATLTSLREVDISIDPHSLSAVSSVLEPFQNLVKFFLSASSPNLLLPIVDLIRQAPLEVLAMRALNTTISISAVEFHSLITTLFEGNGRCSLTYLILRTGGISITEPGTIEPRTFQTLAAFSQLRTIMIDLDLSISLMDDALLEEMAQEWPHAEKIVFNYTPTLYNVAKATFKGLTSLVQHCPRLQILLLPFTATNPDPSLLENIASNGISNEAIRNFSVGWSAIGDSNSDVQVATEILVALFPGLRELKWHGMASYMVPADAARWSRRVQRWNEVSRLVSRRATGDEP